MLSKQISQLQWAPFLQPGKWQLYLSCMAVLLVLVALDFMQDSNAVVPYAFMAELVVCLFGQEENFKQGRD